MSLLAYAQIINLINRNVIKRAEYDAINSASLDIHLGNTILVEEDVMSRSGPGSMKFLNKKSPLEMEKIVLNEGSQYVLAPGEFILCQSREIFNLPDNISAEYKLKSSMARLGLDHLNAGWCDAGWNGSVLTLELVNVSRYHRIVLTVGDRIGQMIFFQHQPVPSDKSYAVRGSYNGDLEARGVKTK